MRQAGHLHAAALALCRAVLAQVYDASEQLRGLLQTDALGALGMAGSEPLDEEQLESSRLLWVLWNFDSGWGQHGQDDFGPSSRKRSYTAIRDWGPQVQP